MAAVLERSFIEICGFERETLHRFREVPVNLGKVSHSLFPLCALCVLSVLLSSPLDCYDVLTTVSTVNTLSGNASGVARCSVTGP